MITTYSSRDYRITYQGIALIENALERPDLVQVSVASGCTILVAPQEEYGIDYEPNGEYRSWNMQGVNTQLARAEAHFIYARLNRTDRNALLLFSVNDYTIDGKIIKNVESEGATTLNEEIPEGGETIEEGDSPVIEGEPSEYYYYIKIGGITKTDSLVNPTLDREITLDFGYLSTPAGQEGASAEWRELFEVTAENLIRPLKQFTSFAIKGTLNIIGKLVLNDKQITDVARDMDEGDFTPSDEIVPTTQLLMGKYLEELRKILINKDREDQTNFLLKFGEFIDSMIAGKGTGIFPNGRIQTDRLEVRGSMTVMELIINEISAMMGDFSFSDCGHIEKVEPVSDGTYKLWMRKETELDFTSLDENDILYSIVNNLKTGGTDYYTSWMRVLTKNVNDNTLTIVLYPDAEVPGGKNYPPVAGYNLTRRGNSVLPDEGQINGRSQSWLLSSREGRIMFLANVYKPILEDYNYAISIGKFPKIEAIANLPISDTDMGIMAKTIVCEQLYQYDYNGDIIPNKVDRGEWSLAVAQSDQPYRFIQHDRLYPDGQHTYTELEQHTVYHYGCKWGCIIDKTQDEPVWNSPSWVLLEGDKNYHLEFESSNGWQFFLQQVNTDIKAVVSYGNRDITNTLMATTGVEVEWLRDTGNVPSDNSWKPTYVNGHKHVIHLSVADMGSGWGSEYRKISFICRVFIPVGEDFKTVENSINIKI